MYLPQETLKHGCITCMSLELFACVPRLVAYVAQRSMAPRVKFRTPLHNHFLPSNPMLPTPTSAGTLNLQLRTMASSADMSGPRRQMASMFQAPYPAAASLPGSPSSLKHLTVKTSSAGLDGKPAAYAHPYSYFMQQASLPSTSEHFGGQSQASLQGPGTSLNNTSDQRSSQVRSFILATANRTKIVAKLRARAVCCSGAFSSWCGCVGCTYSFPLVTMHKLAEGAKCALAIL